MKVKEAMSRRNHATLKNYMYLLIGEAPPIMADPLWPSKINNCLVNPIMA